TFLGGTAEDLVAGGLAVDASGAVTLAGATASGDLPTTAGAFDAGLGGVRDGFVCRVALGTTLYADRHRIDIATGGTQALTVHAGAAHAGLTYWIFGSITGSRPGIDLLGVHIPLNPDPYTDLALGAINTPVFTRFR